MNAFLKMMESNNATHKYSPTDDKLNTPDDQ
jgi:hypothetical protein